jgi:hypothetical protein
MVYLYTVADNDHLPNLMVANDSESRGKTPKLLPLPQLAADIV